ncbi:MAG: hypothetical protein AAF539_06510 [Planctomycetota bacterium]
MNKPAEQSGRLARFKRVDLRRAILSLVFVGVGLGLIGCQKSAETGLATTEDELEAYLRENPNSGDDLMELSDAPE